MAGTGGDAFWPPGVSLARMAALTFPGSRAGLPRAQVLLPTKVPVCVPAAGPALKCQVPGLLWWGNWSVEKGHRPNASCLERRHSQREKVAVRSGFWGRWLRRNQACFLLTDGGPLRTRRPPRQTNCHRFSQTKRPRWGRRRRWHLHLLSVRPLKVQGGISALPEQINALVSLRQPSLPAEEDRMRRVDVITAAAEYSYTFFSGGGGDLHLEPPGRRTLFIIRRQWGVA